MTGFDVVGRWALDIPAGASARISVAFRALM